KSIGTSRTLEWGDGKLEHGFCGSAIDYLQSRKNGERPFERSAPTVMNTETLLSELTFKAIRSSGPGGQHVNKTASKVEVSFNLETSEALSEMEKERLRSKIPTKISSEGIITLQCGETRSQHKNKAIVIERLIELLQQNLKVAKPRKKTKP